MAASAVQLAPFRIESWARTHEGRVRDHNEDSYCAREPQGFWAVADGMGGHEGGEWASATLVGKLESIDLPHDLERAQDLVAEAIGEANRVILHEAQRRRKQMGSTVVTLLMQDRRYAVLWVGDSRAYLLRDGALLQLSRDHSQVQDMVERGLMRAEDAVGHPMSHILSRAVGVTERVEVDRVTGEVEPGDVFLLCSDGLHGYLRPEEIPDLSNPGGQWSVQRFIDLANSRGGRDNITAVVVEVC